MNVQLYAPRQGSPRTLRGLALLLVVAGLLAVAACSSSSPAPVVNRTSPPPIRAAGAPAPIVAAPGTGGSVAAPVTAPVTPAGVAGTPPASGPSPAATTGAQRVEPAADAGGVQTAPIRSAGVEVRSLETRPLPAAPVATPPATGDGSAAPGAVRTLPKGMKRPYSDVALAEMRALEMPAAPGARPTPGLSVESKTDPKAEGKVDPKAEARPEPKADAKVLDPKADAKLAAGEFAWPAKGKVMQTFAESKNKGIWIAGTIGEPVLAAGDGRVIFSGPGPRGYGNLIIVKHDAETLTVYAHNKALLVKEGASVKRGQRIADLGDSGTDKPKLHFEVRKQGKPIDPVKLLPAR